MEQLSEDRKKFPEASSMRENLAFIAGARWGDNRKSIWSRVPRVLQKLFATEKEPMSYRTVKALWYGEIDANHWAARDIKRAVAILEARRELRKSRERNEIISQRLNAIDPDFHQPSIAAHRGLATGRGAMDQPGDND